MAQLKDLIVTGTSRFISDVILNNLKITGSLQAPTTAGGSTYGSGTSGQVLLSNANGVYWNTLTSASVGLGNVENTALSTWTGSTNITTLGTITTGTVPLANISDADDLKAIEALTGTSGLLKKTAANTWTLDTTAYTTNTGTVTSITAGAGLSGGTITGSGTIAHSNSVTAQTTQAIYPIKIDSNQLLYKYNICF